MKQFKYFYGCIIGYRETENSELKQDSIFFDSNDKDMHNACEIEMLKYLTKHNYYSGKVIKEKAF